MYITSNFFTGENSLNFDWENFFNPKSLPEFEDQCNFKEIVCESRKHLRENKFYMSFILSKLMKNLLNEIDLTTPSILELGAATGFLTRWLISQYGGKGVLIDNNKTSYESYLAIKDNLKQDISYIVTDLFKLDIKERFDIVCSFGLIEHFKIKKKVVEVHKFYIKPNGIIIILVPLDTPLSRAFLELHPEKNLGYRELLTEKELKTILLENGLRVLNSEVSSGYSYDFIGAVCSVIDF